MVDTKKITELDPGSTPLAGDELMEMVQAGESVKIPSSAFPPIGGSYITLTGIGALTGSRRLVAGSNISLVDGGPGTTLTISASGAATGFGDGWDWTTSVTQLKFQFPTILADWLEVDDDGVNGSLFIGGLEDIEIASNDFLSLFAEGTAEISADIIRLQGNSGIELDGTVGTAGQVPVSGGPGAEVTWGDQATSGGLTLVEQSSAYEFVIEDANTGVVNPLGNGANIYDIPANAFVPFPVGTFLVVVNRDVFKTVVVTSGGTIINAQTGAEGSITIAGRGMATFLQVDIDEWECIGANIS